jgi:hypothetical protein
VAIFFLKQSFTNPFDAREIPSYIPCMKIIAIQLFNTSNIKNDSHDYEKNNAKKQKTQNFATFSKMLKKQKTHSMFQSFQK